jgi:hypothetical protein
MIYEQYIPIAFLIFLCLVLCYIIKISFEHKTYKKSHGAVVTDNIVPYLCDPEYPNEPDNIGLSRRPVSTNNWNYYIYYCKCGTTLTEGPSGGCSVNAVCEKCRVNYGCLPGYYGE